MIVYDYIIFLLVLEVKKLSQKQNLIINVQVSLLFLLQYLVKNKNNIADMTVHINKYNKYII
jgi:hypothetical protein